MNLWQHIARVVRSPWQDRVNGVHASLALLKTAFYYRLIFAEIGKRSAVYKPLLLSGTRFIHIGSDTLIRQGARIEAILLDPERPPRIDIGCNVNIEQNAHIVCSSSIKIGNDVSITGSCSITDTRHPYLDVDNPVKVGARIDMEPTPVVIGDGSFLGIGCVVLPGVHIGRFCVLGANSTITRDVPDYSVVAGNPARIVRRYDPNTGIWIRPDSA